MKQAKKKSDDPYIKPPDGVQINKIIVPVTASVSAVGKQIIPQEEKKEQGISVTRDLSKLKTISISAFNLDKLSIQKKESNTESNVNENSDALPKDAVTNEKLLLAWNKYAVKMQSLGKESLYVTLTKRHPQMIDEMNFGFLIDNKVQEQDIEKEKADMIEFIRKEVNNFYIQLQLAITTDENTSTLLYTSRDKFKKLAEKNPNLLELKKRFNLDLEF